MISDNLLPRAIRSAHRTARRAQILGRVKAEAVGPQSPTPSLISPSPIHIPQKEPSLAHARAYVSPSKLNYQQA